MILPYALALLSLLGPTLTHQALPEKELHGTIVLEEPDGTRTTPKAGSIRLYGHGRGDRTVTAAIENGAFEAAFPDPYVFIGAIELDGVACWSFPPWGDELPESALVVAHRVRPAFVHVVDAKTGEDLERLDVIIASGSRSERDELALPTTASPFEVPLFDAESGRRYGWIGLRAYRIASPGYATQQVWIDPTEGGARTFELAEEARLRIAFTGSKPMHAGTSVALTPSGSYGAPPFWRDVTDGTVEFDALAAGSWNIGIIDAGGYQPSRFSRVELAAGQVLALELDPEVMDPNTQATQHALRGTLEFLGGTPAILPPLNFESRRTADGPFHAWGQVLPDDFAQDAQRANVWNWYFGEVAPAWWRFSIPEWSWAQEFESTSDDPIELVAPNPGSGSGDEPTTTRDAAHARVTMRFDLVDEDTGEVVPPELAKPSRTSRAGKRECERAGEHWTVVAREGPMRILIHSSAYAEPAGLVLAARTDAVLRVPIRLKRRFTIHAYDGDARIGAPEIKDLLKPSIESVDASGEFIWSIATTSGENEFFCNVVGSGRFRITLPPSDRYAPRPPVEVVVKPDGSVPVAEFHLTRAERARK